MGQSQTQSKIYRAEGERRGRGSSGNRLRARTGTMRRGYRVGEYDKKGALKWCTLDGVGSIYFDGRDWSGRKSVSFVASSFSAPASL